MDSSKPLILFFCLNFSPTRPTTAQHRSEQVEARAPQPQPIRPLYTNWSPVTQWPSSSPWQRVDADVDDPAEDWAMFSAIFHSLQDWRNRKRLREHPPETSTVNSTHSADQRAVRRVKRWVVHTKTVPIIELLKFHPKMQTKRSFCVTRFSCAWSLCSFVPQPTWQPLNLGLHSFKAFVDFHEHCARFYFIVEFNDFPHTHAHTHKGMKKWSAIETSAAFETKDRLIIWTRCPPPPIWSTLRSRCTHENSARLDTHLTIRTLLSCYRHRCWPPSRSRSSFTVSAVPDVDLGYFRWRKLFSSWYGNESQLFPNFVDGSFCHFYRFSTTTRTTWMWL